MQNITDQTLKFYVESNTQTDSDLCEELRSKTFNSMEFPEKISGRCTAQLLKLLINISQARFVADIGMFTGYSALSMAEALPTNGRVITCEINPKAIKFAKQIFAKSSHGYKISIQQIRAIQLLEQVSTPLDLAYIDADKKLYPVYYQKVLEKLKPGGIIVIDNMLWSGDAIKQETDRGKILAQLNSLITKDKRVENLLLAIDDGVQVIRKIT